jgi:ATP-binding cassette, subfamily C, type I secretion system permease/ATPase
LDPRTEHEAANSLAEDQESESDSANGHAKAANGSASGANGSASNGNASGANGSANSANGSAGAPNGHQPSSMLLQRTIDTDFRTVLGKGLAACRRNIFNAAIFSFVVNVLLLAMPIYLFQLSDRVYTSRSHDTLIRLSVVVGGATIAPRRQLRPQLQKAPGGARLP